MSDDKLDWVTVAANALEEAIEMFDAVPMKNDLSPEYSIPSYAIRASMLHTALELGMKAILKQHHGSRAVPRTHELVKIYLQLPARLQQKLDNAFTDAVHFYGFRTERDDLTHLADLQTYLGATGGEGRFVAYRYWALESNKGWLAEPMAILCINREMARYIADKLTGFASAIGGPFTISQLVERNIAEALFRRRYQPLPQREQEDPEGWRTDDNALTEWLGSQDSLLSAMKSAFQLDFNIVNEQSADVLRRVHADLSAESEYRVKPALQHALLTFRVF